MVEARDRFGNLRHQGGDSVSAKTSACKEWLHIDDLGDGPGPRNRRVPAADPRVLTAASPARSEHESPLTVDPSSDGSAARCKPAACL